MNSTRDIESALRIWFNSTSNKLISRWEYGPVAPGTYLENMNFKGKNIIITSQFILNNNLDFIYNTVIDGSNPAHSDSANCVSFRSGEDSSAVIQGFTITGGQVQNGLIQTIKDIYERWWLFLHFHISDNKNEYRN